MQSQERAPSITSDDKNLRVSKLHYIMWKSESKLTEMKKRNLKDKKTKTKTKTGT